MNPRGIISSLLIILLSRCTPHNDESPIFDPFEINFNVTEKGLIADGYVVMPEDVPLLGKQIGDTLIYYQLNNEWDSLTNKSNHYKCKL